MVKIGDMVKIKDSFDAMGIKFIEGDVYKISNIQEFPKGLSLELEIEDKGYVWVTSDKIETINIWNTYNKRNKISNKFISCICCIPLILTIPLGISTNHLKGEMINNITIAERDNKVDIMFENIKMLERRERRMIQMEKDRLLKIEAEKLKTRLEKERLEKEKREQEELNKKRNLVDTQRSKNIDVGNSQNVSLEVSFYCSCSICSGNWGGQTAMGIPVREGIVAMPKDIPLGSKLHIDGLGEFLVADRGGYIKKVNGVYRVDVYVPTHEEALRRGRYNTSGIVYYK